MKYKLLIIFCALTIAVNYSQTPGELDTSFNSDDIGFRNGDSFNGAINKTITLSDGTILVLGNFSYYNNIEVRGIAKLNLDGTLDASFVTNIQNSAIYDGLLEPDGKLLVRGSFTVDGQSGIQLVRLNQDGSLDMTFTPGTADQTIMKVERQSDGKYILIGYFSTYNGQSSSKIIRLNPDGTYDSTYAIGNGFTSGFPQHISLQSDNKVIVGGSGLYYNDQVVTNNLIRINADGTKDASFNFPITTTNISALCISNNDKLFVSRYTSSMYFAGYVLNKLNFDGSIDNSFAASNLGYNGSINKIVEQPDGKVLIAGYSVSNNTQQYKMVRYNTDGTIDNSFIAANFNQFLSGIALSENTIIASGQFSICNGEASRHIAILDNNGQLMPSLEPEGYGVNGNNIQHMIAQPDGKILIAGDFYKYNGDLAPRLARIFPDGSRDTSFNIGDGPNAALYDIKILPNGKIAVAGLFSSFNNSTRYRLAFLNEDGSLGSGYVVPNINNTVYSILPIDNERLIIAGAFTSVGGLTKNRIAIINQNDGSVDNSIDFGTGFNNQVTGIVAQPDGKLIVYGNFTSYNGTPVAPIIRLNLDGTIDSSFFVTINSVPYTVCMLPNNKILLGGSFTTVNGIEQNRIVCLNNDGSTDNTFIAGNGFNNTIYDFEIDENNKILVVGNFTEFDNTAVNYILRLNANGSLDTSFMTLESNSNILSVLQLPDDKLLIGGSFTSYDAIGKNRLARIFGGEDGTLSDENFNLQRLQLYPNPVHDYFSISTFNSSIKSAKLFNMNGQEVQIFYHGFDRIFVGNLTKGIYFLQIKTERDTQTTLKLIKQ